MAKYEVIKPWCSTVKVGDIWETKSLHPSLKCHVELVEEKTLEVATPKKTVKKKANKKATEK